MSDDATLASPLAPEGGAPLSVSLSDLKKPRNYAVGDTHARGGMGAILCAKDLNINRTVAMKVMLGDRAGDVELASRFVDEAKITGQLEHPNIVPIYELGVDEQNRPFYTMKFVMGVTLKQVLDEIKEGKPETLARYSLAHLLTIFQKTCDAVAFAHARGVVHRDLKPENIMLGEYGEVLVLDWGLAKQLGKSETASDRVGEVADSGRTMDGTIMGTPQFMAPEQAEGQIDRIDARTDIYALGGILYNLLTLQPPVTGNNVNEVLEKVRTSEIALPGEDVPASLAAVAMKAMALRREDRYPSVKEFQLDIEAYQNGFATEAEHASAWKQFVLFINRNKAVSIAVATGLCLLAVVSAVFTLRVIRERNRAERALTDLRKTAPSFYDQARMLTERQKFAEALDKVDAALLLDPSKSEFHTQRGNILQALMRFGEAAASYQQSLALAPDQPYAAENLAMSKKLDPEMTKDGKLSRESLAELFAAYSKQRRVGEGIALGSQLHASMKEQLPLFRANLDRWLGTKYGLDILPNGFLTLRLIGLPVADIEPLHGMPIQYLNLSSTKVSDLSPLAGMPLSTLWLAHCKNVSDLSTLRGLRLTRLFLLDTSVSDISPLTGMPLEELSISELRQIRDLTPLRGMPLRMLQLQNTSVRDLSPLAGMRLEALTVPGYVTDISVLRGMPLKTLTFSEGAQITNLEVIADCPDLEKLVLPRWYRKDIEFLRRMPKLTRLSWVSTMDHLEPTTTAEEFWKEYDAAKAEAGK